MRVFLNLLGGTLLACSIPTPANASDGDDERTPPGARLRCESVHGDLRQCAIPGGAGVRLDRRLSRAPCIQRRSWGQSDGAIWVSDGCRAEFIVDGGASLPTQVPAGSAGPDTSRLVSCGSRSGRWTHCDADTRGRVELVRQVSRQPCVRSQSWGTDTRGIWVSGGCRADFRLGTAPWAAAPAARFRCESRRGRRTHCEADMQAGVRVVRQLSRAACVEAATWGVEPRGVWVQDGCRAEFEVAAPARRSD